MQLTFDDILLKQQFSTVSSRKNVDLGTRFGSFYLKLPIVSANMASVTGVELANKMFELGAMGCHHRFYPSILDNVDAYRQSPNSLVSVGLGDEEFDRFSALYEVGARDFIIDVAHGAQMSLVRYYNEVIKKYPEAYITIGNFSNYTSLYETMKRLDKPPYAVKIGVGNGSACSTRLKTGVGSGQVTALKEAKLALLGTDTKIISDGGIKHTGDISKALALGADLIMSGRLFAPVRESASKLYSRDGVLYKQYSGSASISSYKAQGKESPGFRAAEGVSMELRLTGHLKEVIDDIEGSIRSSLTYTGCKDLDNFRGKVAYDIVSNNVYLEGLTRS